MVNECKIKQKKDRKITKMLKKKRKKRHGILWIIMSVEEDRNSQRIKSAENIHSKKRV